MAIQYTWAAITDCTSFSNWDRSVEKVFSSKKEAEEYCKDKISMWAEEVPVNAVYDNGISGWKDKEGNVIK